MAEAVARLHAEDAGYRMAPHNIEAEQALLGAILVNNEACDRVSGFLLPEHFFEGVHARIFEAASTLIRSGKLASPVTLQSFFVNDETLIGRYDPTSDAYPDLDLTSYDSDSQVSRKHAILMRIGGKYFVRPISNSGTQINGHLLSIGEKTEIEDGDVLILAGALAMKFQVG